MDISSKDKNDKGVFLTSTKEIIIDNGESSLGLGITFKIG